MVSYLLRAAAHLARFETHRVTFRKEAEGQIPAATAEEIIRQPESDIAAGEFGSFPSAPAIETAFVAIMASRYRHTPCVPMRTFDALHLASARFAGETEIVTTDTTNTKTGFFARWAKAKGNCIVPSAD